MVTEDDKQTFARWYSDELDRRGWNGPKMYEKSGIWPNRTSEYRRGIQVPDSTNAQRIADAFNVSPTYVLMKAGRIERDPYVDPEGDRQMLMDLLRRVNLDNPATVKMIRGLLESLDTRDEEAP